MLVMSPEKRRDLIVDCVYVAAGVMYLFWVANQLSDGQLWINFKTKVEPILTRRQKEEEARRDFIVETYTDIESLPSQEEVSE